MAGVHHCRDILQGIAKISSQGPRCGLQLPAALLDYKLVRRLPGFHMSLTHRASEVGRTTQHAGSIWASPCRTLALPP